MVSRSYSNAQFVHNGADVVGMYSLNIKGYYRCFVSCGSVDL